MKKNLLKFSMLLLCFLFVATILNAQDEKDKKIEGYKFTIEKQIKTTSVKKSI